jgi:hypothetical protein
MSHNPSNIPPLWDDESDGRLKCRHSIENIVVEVKGIGGSSTKTKWDVVASHNEQTLKHGERKNTEAEAEELAIEYMEKFDSLYNGNGHKAYVNALENR